MEQFYRTINVLLWIAGFAAFAGFLWIVRHLDIFPAKRLRNTPFSEIKMGQSFFDYGGEELQLREYVKTDELEAQCLSVPGHPLVNFEKKDVVKVEVFWARK